MAKPKQETIVDRVFPAHNITIKRVGPPSKYTAKTYYRQRRPYLNPLPFRLVKSEMEYNFYGKSAKANSQVSCTEFYNKQAADLKVLIKPGNKALNKVHDQLRTADSFFEDWYERKQAYELIHSSGKALLNFIVGWRNPKYWKHLRKNAKPKDFPSAWLGYQFGVKPLLGGVNRAMNLLGQDFPVVDVSGTSGNADEFTYAYWSNSLYHNIRFQGNRTAIVKIGCSVTGINPNKALAGATGLNEPFSSAWAVVPWGWAVDYFFNVSELLSNIENQHPGIKTERWYTTHMVRSYGSIRPDYEPTSSSFRAWSHDCSVTGLFIERIIGSTGFKPELKFPPLGGNKQANLFSAIALTASGLKKH